MNSERLEQIWKNVAGMKIPEYPNTNYGNPIGWTCPKCGKVFSPNTSQCPYCNKLYEITCMSF